VSGERERDLVERLWELSQQHTPGRVLVLVRDSISARWLTSLLVERGAAVGLRVLDLEGLLTGAATELAGEAIAPARVLAEVRGALADDPQQAFAAILEHPSYQREVLRTFVELERAGIETPLRPHGRDAILWAAFERFRERMSGHRGWWRGQAPKLVGAGHRRVSFLRRRAAAVALGFAPALCSGWELQLLEVLGFERWGFERWGSALGSTHPSAPLDLRLACAGPEAEIAEVARLLRAEPERPAVVLAPADAVPRWVARLRHRDVPVRAWVEHRAANTGAARVARALLRTLAEPRAVRRDDLELLLFGPALRAWASLADELGVDWPRAPNPGDLRTAWEAQRASAFSLASLSKRLLAAGDAALERLDEHAARFAWPAELLAARRTRSHDAHRLLAAAIARLDRVASEPRPSALASLLEDWDLLGRAAVHSSVGPELIAARIIVDLCKRASERDDAAMQVASFATDLDHALAGASTGSWEQSRALGGGGGPPVWVLPYASVSAIGRLPARVFLTGLDAHPHPPVHHGPISDALRRELGLRIDGERFELELRLLDELVETAHRGGANVVGSWRQRDGVGGQRPPGPWIAGRQDEGRARAVGVDIIALPPADQTPSAPLEQALRDWSREPELRRRVEAMRAHEGPLVGPHTGELGITVPASAPYSASALQRYAALPYRYFVERVIGLRERELGETASSLLASEQGQVVHRALESAHLARLSAGPLELASVAEALLTEVLTGLSDAYRKRAEHGQAEAIWSNERDRWARELTLWWQGWLSRLRSAYGPTATANRSEPDACLPGLFLLAAEWSPGSGDDGAFELDLGLRTLPFVAVIDRIELDPRRQRIDVVDYKTGRPRFASELAAELRAGVHLQLPLYALAVQQVVARAPERLRLPVAAPVAALRLEYLQRPLPRGSKPSFPEARGFVPTRALGVDASGQTWTIIDAAISFTIAFVSAIEAGRFPMVARDPARRSFHNSRFDELARVIPPADRRATSLPPPLLPLPDPQAAKLVVQ
jgi:hypothetical protein